MMIQKLIVCIGRPVRQIIYEYLTNCSPQMRNAQAHRRDNEYFSIFLFCFA